MRAFLTVTHLSLIAAGLTACGADGPPVPPAEKTAITFSGSAAIVGTTKVN